MARAQPSEVAREHIRFTTQPLEHTDGHDELLFEMLEAVGAPDILCFASDYPHWDFDDPAFMLKRLPEAWRDKVLHDNAAELYGERLGSTGVSDWQDVGSVEELERDRTPRRPGRRP